MDSEIGALFRDMRLWGEDLLRITFLPTGLTMEKVIERDRSFTNSLFHLVLSLALVSLVYWLKNSLEYAVLLFVALALISPVLLIIYAAVLKKFIKNPKLASKYHEGLFHIGALAYSAGMLMGAPFIFLPEPFGSIGNVAVLLYFLLVIATRLIRRMLKISIVSALGRNLAGLLLTIPLFFLMMVFLSLFSGTVSDYLR